MKQLADMEGNKVFLTNELEYSAEYEYTYYSIFITDKLSGDVVLVNYLSLLLRSGSLTCLLFGFSLSFPSSVVDSFELDVIRHGMAPQTAINIRWDKRTQNCILHAQERKNSWK